MVVDISFSPETVKGLDVAYYKKGITSTVKALKDCSHIFMSGTVLLHVSLKKILLHYVRKLKALQPDIILSASEAYKATPKEYLKFMAETEMDIANYHESRQAPGGTVQLIELDRCARPGNLFILENRVARHPVRP